MRCYELDQNTVSFELLTGLWTDGWEIGWDGRALSFCCYDRPDINEADGRIHWARVKEVKPKHGGPSFHVLAKPLRKDHRGRWLDQDLKRDALVLLNVPFKSYDLTNHDGWWLETPGGTLVVIPEGKHLRVGGYYLTNEGGDLQLVASADAVDAA